MIDGTIAFKNGSIAARVFVCRTEEDLGKIKEPVCCPCIAEIDKPAELKPAYVVTQGQHIALVEIVVAEHGTAAFPQKAEASFC